MLHVLMCHCGRTPHVILTLISKTGRVAHKKPGQTIGSLPTVALKSESWAGDRRQMLEQFRRLPWHGAVELVPSPCVTVPPTQCIKKVSRMYSSS
jgi:hypothetical protein